MGNARQIAGPLSLKEDLHIHSTFSDGQGSLQEIHDRALRRGLERICFVDHVRRETAWVPTYVRAVQDLRRRSAIELLCGVEAKLLDEDGTLDLPEEVDACDVVVVADHRLPFEDRCLKPEEARRLLETGQVTSKRLIEGLIRATCQSLKCSKSVIVAHLFSILPKIGLSEGDVDKCLILELGKQLRAARAVVEISERWRCPGAETLDLLARCGVAIVASTDSHDLASIGRFDYVAKQAAKLGSASRSID